MIHFKYLLEKRKLRIEKVLTQYLHIYSNPENIEIMQAMKYSTLQHGKRIRSFLVYQVGQLFGIKPKFLNAPASAIEFIHSYSLIHDDLPSMDNDELRRGMPSCHVKFGEAIAILAGNALQSLAFEILSEIDISIISLNNKLHMISLLAHASGCNGMCVGQAMDVISSQKKISITCLEQMYKYKTSELIRAAVKMAVVAANKYNHPVMYDLDRFAITIGLAFQIQNDILDIIGHSQITGKKCGGSDRKLNKKTYPLLLGIDAAKLKIQELYYESLSYLKSISDLGYNVKILTELTNYLIHPIK